MYVYIYRHIYIYILYTFQLYYMVLNNIKYMFNLLRFICSYFQFTDGDTWVLVTIGVHRALYRLFNIVFRLVSYQWYTNGWNGVHYCQAKPHSSSKGLVRAVQSHQTTISGFRPPLPSSKPSVQFWAISEWRIESKTLEAERFAFGGQQFWSGSHFWKGHYKPTAPACCQASAPTGWFIVFDFPAPGAKGWSSSLTHMFGRGFAPHTWKKIALC